MTAVTGGVEEVAMREPLGPLAWKFCGLVEKAGAADESTRTAALAAGLLMRATLAGHICLSPDEVAEHAADAGIEGLSADAMRSALPRHPWVGGGDGPSPLVYEGDRLYLRRFRDAENRLALAILSRVALPPDDVSLVKLSKRFREVFPPIGGADWQAVAVAAALRSRFTLITGGPGTGKTTTVANLLALLLEQDPNVKVALAAPTGKAATRLGEAIRQRWDVLGIAPGVQERLPSTGQTLHRLLGYLPQRDEFQRNANDPLEHDVVIVDEASMVPLLLMDTLFCALRRDARIILLGDHDQLASVEAGSVLSDLVSASGALTAPHGTGLGTAYAALSGQSIPTSPNVPALRDAVVRLTKSHRFDDTKGIGALARAIRDGDADAALAVLSKRDESVTRGPVSSSDEGWVDAVAADASTVLEAPSPAAAIQALNRARVLCATNIGRAGTEAIVARVEQALRRRGKHVAGSAYRGRPFLVSRNDYSLQLFNGDIGVIWEGEGIWQAFVAGSDPAAPPRSFPLPQLPDAATAWAMTIHKAQGSEFDTVVVVLPDVDVRALSRELLYTAVSRAKTRVIIVGPDETIRTAIGRSARRGSGLSSRLV